MVDKTGHKTGFGPDSPEYMKAVETIDSQIQRILTAIESRQTRQEEEWIIAVTTDHSANDKRHGPMDEINRTIPLILNGDGLKTGQIPADCNVRVSHMDVFHSVMEYLRLPIKD